MGVARTCDEDEIAAFLEDHAASNASMLVTVIPLSDTTVTSPTIAELLDAAVQFTIVEDDPIMVASTPASVRT